MEVVYYYDKELGHSPVKKYLSESLGGLDEAENRKLVVIYEKIIYISRTGGTQHPAKPVKNFSNLFEFWQRKDAKIVIRFVHGIYMGKMVLLVAFEKPANYESQKEKKRVIKFYELANERLKMYIKNPNIYETF